MQFKKRIVSLLAVVILCLNFSVDTYADTVTVNSLENEDISPAYVIANSCTADLEIQNGTAYCTSIAEGTDAVCITVTQTLQKYWGLWIWNDVNDAIWSKHINGSSIYLSNSKSGLDSGTYRVKSVFVLTDGNGESETITIYSNEQKVP
ncbi:MAG: hypothetical protein ACI4JS_07720 [Oscillospiraceae bacterium]